MVGDTTLLCPHCQAANPGAARFCMFCGTPIVASCPHCGAVLPVGARLCISCGQAPSAVTPTDRARLSRLAAALPAPLQDKLRATPLFAGELRHITTLLVDIAGSSHWSRLLGRERWGEVINGAFDRFHPIIYRYEGTIVRVMGDALLIFFGAPVAHEDDPQRAVCAALDLLRAARVYADEIHALLDVQFALRLCISTGPVVVGPQGSNLTYDYTDSGDAVTLTALMHASAPTMAVIVSAYTYRFVEPLVEAIELEPLAVHGREAPIRLFQITRLRLAPGRLRGFTGIESPLVGRANELADLLRLTEALAAGLGRVAFILGDPGLGKTRLVAEWRSAVMEQHSTAFRWVTGHCLSYGHDIPYHLLVNLLHGLIDVPPTASEIELSVALVERTNDLLGGEASEIRPFLAHLLAIASAYETINSQMIDPQTLRTQYLHAVRTLLRAMALRSPIVLVLEDIHWADPSSADLLARLLPLSAELPILFCMLTRIDHDSPGWQLVNAARTLHYGSLTEIQLNALSTSDSQQLVANLLAVEALPAHVRDMILKKAEGNPFFMEEVIRMLIDHGAIVRDVDRWVLGHDIDAIEIPDNLRSLLLARIDRLPEEIRHTLRIAAVIGRQFPLRVLDQVLRKEAHHEPT